jgi:hypothetical protein
VFDIVFRDIIDRRTAEEARLFRVRYQPRPRIMQIGIGWRREGDYPRAGGFFALHKGAIYHINDILTWPKTEIVETAPAIADMSDAEIIERVITVIGAPWAQHYSLPPEAGILRHDARSLLKHASLLKMVAPRHHEREVEDILRRITDFNRAIGA